jgi:hypothetical protein
MEAAGISTQERLDLRRVMDRAEDYQDNTDYIRRVRHSARIAEDALRLQKLRADYVSDHKAFAIAAHDACPFLVSNYPDILARLVREELDMSVFAEFLSVLNAIELGEVDQQDGSVMVGKLLRRLYLDSAVKAADNRDRAMKEDTAALSGESSATKSPLAISWREFKVNGRGCAAP